VKTFISCLVIFTTNNMFQAKRPADKATLLMDGSVIEEAGVIDFFSNQKVERADRFTRGGIVFE
jgi:ABC-type phosphate transport system ATPase subunit